MHSFSFALLAYPTPHHFCILIFLEAQKIEKVIYILDILVVLKIKLEEDGVVMANA